MWLPSDFKNIYSLTFSYSLLITLRWQVSCPHLEWGSVTLETSENLNKQATVTFLLDMNNCAFTPERALTTEQSSNSIDVQNTEPILNRSIYLQDTGWFRNSCITKISTHHRWQLVKAAALCQTCSLTDIASSPVATFCLHKLCQGPPESASFLSFPNLVSFTCFFSFLVSRASLLLSGGLWEETGAQCKPAEPCWILPILFPLACVFC